MPTRPLRPLAIALALGAAVSLGALLLARTPRPTPDERETHDVRLTVTRASAGPVETPRAPIPMIRGRILDAEGNPVADAAVRLVSPTLPLAILGETTSDLTGGFSFATAPSAHVRVVAHHDPEGVVTSAVLDAAEGKAAEVSLVLSASGVRGTVVDADGRAVPDVTISVSGVPWRVPAATSDADGAFHLATVPNEATALVAVARGYRRAQADLVPPESAGDRIVHLRLATATAVSGDARDVEGDPVRAQIVACGGQQPEVRVESAADGTFELPPSAIGCDAVAKTDDSAPSDAVPVVDGRRLSLRLKGGGWVEGVVVDERGNRMPAFSIGIESSSTANGSGARPGTRNFESTAGTFRWDKLAPGRYVLTATAPGRPPTRSDPVDIAGGVATRDVRIVLPQGGSVTGRVYDERHVPLAGVDLRFDAVSSVVVSSAEAKTDEAGHYLLGGAPAGPFTLRVQKAGFRPRLLSGLRVDARGMLTEDITLADANGAGGFDFGGIGANLAQERDGISLASVLPGEAAERAGLRAGDRIRRIDGEETDTMSIADALQRLRGPAGTSVGVSVQRPSGGETVNVMLVRATIVRTP